MLHRLCGTHSLLVLSLQETTTFHLKLKSQIFKLIYPPYLASISVQLFTTGPYPPYLASISVQLFTAGTYHPYLASISVQLFTTGTYPPYLASISLQLFTTGTYPPYLASISVQLFTTGNSYRLKTALLFWYAAELGYPEDFSAYK